MAIYNIPIEISDEDFQLLLVEALSTHTLLEILLRDIIHDDCLVYKYSD